MTGFTTENAAGRRGRRRDREADGADRGHARLVINSAVVSSLTAVGVVTGFLDDAVIAMLFGLTGRTDAFYMAWTIPWAFGPLLTISAYSALVPAFTQRLELEGSDGAWRLLNAIIGVVGGVLFLISVLGAAGATWIMRGLAPGFDTGQYALTVSLARLLFPLILFNGLTAVIKAFLYAHRVFTFPTLLTPLSDLLVIAMILLLAAPLGITGVAVAFLSAAALQLAIALYLLARHVGFRLRPSLDLRAPGLRAAFGMYGIMVGGQGLRRMVILLERFLASYLPAGSIFALNIGNKLNMMVGGVFFSSMTTVILPDLSTGMLRTQLERVRRDLLAGLKLITLVSLPVSIAFLILRVPLVQVLFERGAVTRTQTLLVASILGYYVLSIPGMGYFRLVQNFYYSAVSGRAASFMFVYAAVVNAVLDVVLVRVMGPQGIALAWSVSVSLAAVTGLLMLERRVPGVSQVDLLRYATKVAAVSLATGAALVVAYRVIGALLPGRGEIGRAILVGGTVAAGVLTFLVLASVLRVSELRILLGALRRRVSRRRRPVPAALS